MKYIIKNNLNLDGVRSDKEIITNYPQLRNIRKCVWAEGVCFNYALKTPDILDCESASDFVFENFKEVAFKNIRKGDIVMIWSREQVNHFAVVIQKGNTPDNTIVRSKLGIFGIYDHKLQYSPNSYGHEIYFWRKKT
jgi:hypothetical protein